MFARWGRFVHRFRWPVLILSALLLSGSIAIVLQGAKLESGGFIETAESGRASRLIERELPTAGTATFTLIYSSPTLSAKDPAFRAEVERSLEPLKADPRVDTIRTAYDGSIPDPTTVISKDGRATA
ncbi:MAG: hypothetical protein HYY42_06425, partial [Chloroflexi bacterium]|nr:hypothetical protein [Chloroflexota bacterium]